MKLKYILFDLDGTLTDPAPGITGCVNYALEKFGKGVEDLSQLNAYIGPPLVASFERFHGLTHEQALKGLEYYRERFATEGIFQNVMYPEIPVILRKLKQDGYTLILATSKPEEFASLILKHFGIFEYFDFIAGNTLNEERQTKASVIEYIREIYTDLSGRNAIMVGDRRYDTEGAAACGIYTIGVLYGYGDLNEHKAAGTRYLADTPQEICDIINRIDEGEQSLKHFNRQRL